MSEQEQDTNTMAADVLNAIGMDDATNVSRIVLDIMPGKPVKVFVMKASLDPVEAGWVRWGLARAADRGQVDVSVGVVSKPKQQQQEEPSSRADILAWSAIGLAALLTLAAYLWMAYCS